MKTHIPCFISYDYYNVSYEWYHYYNRHIVCFSIGIKSKSYCNGTRTTTQLNGKSFQMDNMTFSYNTVSVNGIKLHYVIGGHGDPVVLLHGWPETWYGWHKIMPPLAKNYTVIAPDLRGLGDSSKPPSGYDGKTVVKIYIN